MLTTVALRRVLGLAHVILADACSTNVTPRAGAAGGDAPEPVLEMGHDAWTALLHGDAAVEGLGADHVGVDAVAAGDEALADEVVSSWVFMYKGSDDSPAQRSIARPKAFVAGEGVVVVADGVLALTLLQCRIEGEGPVCIHLVAGDHQQDEEELSEKVERHLGLLVSIRRWIVSIGAG